MSPMLGVVALLLCAVGEPAARGQQESALLDSLPVGIKVTHAPKRVLAKQTDGRYRYTWIFTTRVRALEDPITVEEFGVLTWSKERWTLATLTGRPYTAKDFAAWYSCPKGVLVPGQEFMDPYNWSAAGSLVPAKKKWYFIGRDSKGKRVKGESVVRLLPRLEPTFLERHGTARTRLVREGPAPQVWEEEDPPPGFREVTYSSGDLELKSWLFMPESKKGERRPALVYLHPGHALKAEDVAACKPFMDAGFVVMCPMLRGENGNPGSFELFRGEVHDARAAVRWVAKRPSVDPRRVYCFGHETGGAISAMLSLMDKAVVQHSGSSAGLYDAGIFDDWHEIVPFDLESKKERNARSLADNLVFMRHQHFAFVAKEDPLAERVRGISKMRGCDPKYLTIRWLDGERKESLLTAVRAYLEIIRSDPK